MKQPATKLKLFTKSDCAVGTGALVEREMQEAFKASIPQKCFRFIDDSKDSLRKNRIKKLKVAGSNGINEKDENGYEKIMKL